MADTMTTSTASTAKKQEISTERPINEIVEEYELDFTTFTDIDERLLDIEDKWNSLKETDRTILILYAEYKSYRKVASMLGFSHSTIRNYIQQIREKLC